jgi:hypothetical protein
MQSIMFHCTANGRDLSAVKAGAGCVTGGKVA